METKERIKDRILKRAARVWGYNDQELITSFDPVVAMLLEACGIELERISSEQENSRSRIVERLLEIMMPETRSGILPSRAIVHANPSENNLNLTLEHQFHTIKNLPNIYNPVEPIVKKISFGATGEFQLATADLAYVAFANKMYTQPHVLHKEPFTQSQEHLPQATLWLGIQCQTNMEKLEKLMFYTDIRNSHQKEIFYHYLFQAKIFHQGKQYTMSKGFNVNTDVDVNAIVNQNYNQIEQIYSEVNQFYEQNFFYIAEDLIIDEEAFAIPEELTNCFSIEKLKELDDVLWLKLEFPETMIDDILENAMFALNCFPVINKTLNRATQEVDAFINYIPLETDEHFLDLNEVSDSLANQYHLKNFSEGNLESGWASLRNSGVVRFDKRNASDLIQYLLELLKDESASFSVLGGDFLDENLKQLNQLIATLEQQTKEQDFTQSNFPYIIVRPKKEVVGDSNELMIVEYWSCAGEDANDIRPNTLLTTEKGADFVSKTSYLVTPSVGGKNRLSVQDKILSYRSALLAHGRIVTFADIRAFCLDHFKQSVVDIKLRKGTKKDSAINKGFERTIDIIITRNLEIAPPISDTEWKYLCDNLMHKLERVSSNVYPYRLIIE